ncbi:MAG TPA: DNA-binding protein [Actinomycetes bacterium]|jgi:hypothetical protein|nr:DNA-binding protein [Actinomycetes bacterium]
MAQTVRDVLARHDVSLSEEDIAESLERALVMLPSPAAVPLTASEISYLATHAGPDAADTIATWNPRTEFQERVSAVVAATSSLVASTLGIDEVAARLGVDRSRVSHRISAGTLHSFTAAGTARRRRIPAWQLTTDGLLPGLATVVKAIPANAHPLDVSALMTTPQAELGDRTPVEHLAGGGDPQPVAELLEALGTW